MRKIRFTGIENYGTNGVPFLAEKRPVFFLDNHFVII